MFLSILSYVVKHFINKQVVENRIRVATTNVFTVVTEGEDEFNVKNSTKIKFWGIFDQLSYLDAFRCCSQISSGGFNLFCTKIIEFWISKDKILQKIKINNLKQQNFIFMMSLDWKFKQISIISGFWMESINVEWILMNIEMINLMNYNK